MALAYTDYLDARTTTPQTQPIPGREAEMAPNSAGGYGFILDDWKRLDRFCVLGSEGGTYYVGQAKLTAENAQAVIRCLKQDGSRAVALAYDININNRAPKTDQQLFVIALALSYGDDTTRRVARNCVGAMLRTGTHLLHFVAMLDKLGGWNRTKRRIVAGWFCDHDAGWLAHQVIKYQNRDGWTMRDVLRVSHPVAPTPAHAAVYDYACGRCVDSDHVPEILRAHNFVHCSISSAVDRALLGIQAGLPREALPTEALNEPGVWRALLQDMPLTALLRNLATMSACGVLALGAEENRLVVEKLTNADVLKKSRIHPFAILLAALVYKTGQSVRGNKTWVPVPEIVDALEQAYDLAFESVESTGRRLLVAIDISGSMGEECVGTPIPCSTAAAAMAVTIARMEPNALVVQFDTAVRKVVPITSRTGISGLESVLGGGTDLAAPVQWASGIPSTRYQWNWSGRVALPPVPPLKQMLDAFIILSDQETWAGESHTSQALEHYRKTVNHNARFVCCSMAANSASVVDPNDPLSMGCAGLDANLPSLIADFVKGPA